MATFYPVCEGDWVWIRFEMGDSRRPIITGSCHYAPGGVPNLPHEAFAGDDSLVHQRTGREPVPDESQYHQAYVSTRHGVTIETEPDGSYRVTQRNSGTAVEVTSEGHIVLHASGDALRSSRGDTEEVVGQNLTVAVAGNITFAAGGSVDISAGGEVAINGTKIKLND